MAAPMTDLDTGPSSIRDDSICEPSLNPNKSSGDIGELKPCRKCGGTDVDWWDGRGTQASLYCNGCGQEEGVQVVDLFDQDERPDFDDKALSYPPHAVKRANEHLAQEWNTRTPDLESAAEIERLRRERDEARTIVVEANNSLYGSQGYFHSTNGGPFDKYHLARPIEELKSRARDALTAESALAGARRDRR